jgi:hypothetical protein
LWCKGQEEEARTGWKQRIESELNGMGSEARKEELHGGRVLSLHLREASQDPCCLDVWVARQVVARDSASFLSNTNTLQKLRLRL